MRSSKPHSRNPPPPQRPHAASGVAILLGAALWVYVMALHVGSSARAPLNLTVGQRAPATIVAAADFICSDTTRTDLSRRQAADAVLPVFSINAASFDIADRSIKKLFDRLHNLRKSDEKTAPGADVERSIGDMLDLLGLALSPADAIKLAPTGEEERIYQAIREAFRAVWFAGIVPPPEEAAALLYLSPAQIISIRQPDGTLWTNVTVSSLHTPDKALQSALKQIAAATGTGAAKISEGPVAALLRPWIVPNLAYDPVTTDEFRTKAQKDVETVYVTIRTGTTLVEKGDRINPQIMERLRAHQKRLGDLESPYEHVMQALGSAGLVMGALFICGGLFRILAPQVLRQNSKLILMALLSLLTLLTCKGMLYISDITRLISPAFVLFALPLSLAPLLTTILLGARPALVLGLWNSFVAAVLFDNSFPVLAFGTAATVISGLCAHDVRKRAHVFRAGLSVGLGQTLFAVCLAALNEQAAGVAALQALTGLANGVVCALLVLILLPLFEFLFDLTTNITLLELSDMGNPLLQRLAMDAPGTYHHSLVVANLGQAAAASVGANALLVRVCAYYHDIGKLAKPDFYVENTHLRENPHDDLTPNMSALVILSHVKEGVSLVQQSRLPRSIIDGIQQHHGTSVMSYFYHRARQQGEGNGSGERPVSKEDFRYPGPKPQTREMAILTLADAVEAASRSIEKPTPARVEGLVEEIVNGKLHDGQLDECDLTFAELSEIRKSLVFSLTNMLHARTAYPSDETKTPQPAEKGAAERPEGSAADRMVPGPGPSES